MEIAGFIGEATDAAKAVVSVVEYARQDACRCPRDGGAPLEIGRNQIVAVEVDFSQRAGGLERFFFFDDLAVAGGVIAIGEIGGEALCQAALGDEFAQSRAVAIIGEVDGFSVRCDAADEFVVEGVNVRRSDQCRVISDQRRGRIAVGVVGVGGEAVVDGEGLGLAGDDVRDGAAGGAGQAVSDGVVGVE